MEDEWFYGEGQTQRGPVTKVQLLAALRAMPQPYRVYVWREGMGDWQRAGDVAEVSASLPIDVATTPIPLPPARAPEAPRPEEPRFATSVDPPPGAATDDAKTVAKLFGRLVKLIALQIGLAIAFTIFTTQVPTRHLRALTEPVVILISIAKTLADIGIVILLVVTTYRLMKRMRDIAPVLWALTMLIPYFNIVMLIIINSKAQAWCRERGIKVGLFGPKLEGA